MGNIIVFMSVTLDGVIQAPGRIDEDLRGGFQYGGWALPYSDAEQGRAAGESMATTGGLLFGRRTYEDFYKVWPSRTDGNPFTEILNNTPKYVASRTLKEPLPWMNSTLLKGDAVQTIAELKSQLDKDLVVLGCGNLIQTLMKHNLVDRYILLIHPLVVGSGQRLFVENGPYVKMNLLNAKTTSTGVIIATYEPGV